MLPAATVCLLFVVCQLLPAAAAPSAAELGQPEFIQLLPISVNHSVAQGSTVVLLCTPLPGVRLTWLFDNEELSSSDGRRQLLDEQRKLRIDNASDSDAGRYECVVTDRACEDTRTEDEGSGDCGRSVVARLLVGPAPTFAEAPGNQTVAAGQSATFRCRTDGEQQPAIRWTVGQDGGEAQTIAASEKFAVTQDTLTVANVSQSDAELRYSCVAENEFGRSEAPFRLWLKPNLTTIVKAAIDRARRRVNAAIERTLRKLRDGQVRRSPSDILTLFRLPREAAIELTRARDIYETALRDLQQHIGSGLLPSLPGNETEFPNFRRDPRLLALVAQLAGCQTHARDTSDCESRLCFHLRYRSFDGTCNNLNNPWLGASNTPLKRLLAPQYENGMNEPVGWRLRKTYAGFPKPSARLVSQRLLRAARTETDDQLAGMAMQWGQFLDHDLDFTPVDPADSTFIGGRRCNDTCVNEAPCFPIHVAHDDPRIRHRPCIGFVRSSATCGSGASSLFVGETPYFREQLNQITSFIDASNVYGSTEAEARDVRDLDSDSGLLKVGMPTRVAGKHLLPFSTSQPVDCQSDPAKRDIPCFLAGDHRANEQLGLTSLHTLWMREHNRLAAELRRLNPRWSADRIFFEARKIVGAMHQHITFAHWLPAIVGSEGMKRLGRYRGYDPGADPSVANVFATAAFRFGHTLISPVLHRLNETYQEIGDGSLALHQAFFAPYRLVSEGGIDPVIRGLVARGAKRVSPLQPLNSELTERLFQLAHEVALDLAALNVQRGRDHGLPGYGDWREFCGLHRAESFDDFRWTIKNPDVRERLRAVYGHPDNVDLFVGMVLEDPLEGAQVGPTAMCLIVDQMRRLRSGDRFWYENEDQFTRMQLAQVKRASLARVVCDNADSIGEMQPDAFRLPGGDNQRRPCDRIDAVSLQFWKDCADADAAGACDLQQRRRS